MNQQNQKEKCCSDKFSSILLSLTPEQFTAIAVLIGFLAADDLSVDEQNTLGNFLMTIGQIIVTIAGQKAILEAEQSDSQMPQRIDDLQKQIDDLKSSVLKKDTQYKSAVVFTADSP